MAEEIWDDWGNNCTDIWSFEDEVNEYLDNNCPEDTSYCRGMRTGALKTVNKYEKICLEDITGQCITIEEVADAVLEGGEIAKKIWRDNGSDCGFIFSFQDEVDQYHERKCSTNSTYCKGMRAGLDSIVKEKERICLEDSDECIALGDAAAQEIAFEFCPFGASAFMRPDYKEACREVATGICEGAVGIKVNENGCNINDNNLLMVQNKCEGQVDSMTGGGTSSIELDGWVEPLPEPVVFLPRDSDW
jgi:hypothetical protein